MGTHTGGRGGAEAAVKVQAFLRGCDARRIVSHAYADRLVKVFDGRSGRDFYYNKATNESSWSLPSFVRGADADRIADFDEEGIGSSGSLKAGRYDDKRLHWCVKRGAARRVRAPGDDGAATSSEAAARVLNSFGRCILARKRALKTAEGRFNRIVEDANTIYYVNLGSGDTFWTKPSVYLTTEPPLFENGSGPGGESSRQRSPRVKRLA
jgi:hypothetical protein